MVVVDCDLRNPSLHLQFGIDNSVGLSTALISDPVSSSARSAIRRVDIGGTTIDVLAGGPVVSDPADVIIRSEITDLIDDLQRDYDYVLLDGPPVLPAADALTLARITDGVLLVVRSGQTRASAVRGVESRLNSVSVSVSGAMLVGVRADQLPPIGTLGPPPPRRLITLDESANGENSRQSGNGTHPSTADDVIVL